MPLCKKYRIINRGPKEKSHSIFPATDKKNIEKEH